MHVCDGGGGRCCGCLSAFGQQSGSSKFHPGAEWLQWPSEHSQAVTWLLQHTDKTSTVFCPSLVLSLFVLQLLIVLITVRGDPLHIQTLSRDKHTTNCIFSADSQLTPSLSLSLLSRGIVWHTHTVLFLYSFPLCFVPLVCLWVIIIISQVGPHWTRQLSNQSSATEVMGKTDKGKGGWIREVKEEKEAHELSFFFATGLPSGLSHCLSSYSSSPVKPFLSFRVIGSSVSSPTMITDSTVVCRNTQT